MVAGRDRFQPLRYTLLNTDELAYYSKKCALQMQALGIWASLSLPSIFVTLILYIYPESDDDKGPTMNDVHNFFQDFDPPLFPLSTFASDLQGDPSRW